MNVDAVSGGLVVALPSWKSYTGRVSASDLLSTVLIALGLSMDCFAVAIGGSISMRRVTVPQVARTAVAFGLAQTMMALIGWAIGTRVVGFIASFDHWVAFGLLVFVGGRMIWEATHEEEEEKNPDISRGISLVTLAIATSIDSLAVGLSFAFVDINIAVASIIIGVVALLITSLGFYLGRRVGEILGRRAEIVGGLVLIAIGIRIVVTHLLGG